MRDEVLVTRASIGSGSVLRVLDFQRGGQHTHIQFFKGMDQQLYVSADSLQSLLNVQFGEKLQTKKFTRITEIGQLSLKRDLNGRSVWFLSRSAWLLVIKHTTMADRNFLALLQLDLFHDIQDYLEGNPHPPGESHPFSPDQVQVLITVLQGFSPFHRREHLLPIIQYSLRVLHLACLPIQETSLLTRREQNRSRVCIVSTQNKARSQNFCES